jgi:hypothetical protein
MRKQDIETQPFEVIEDEHGSYSSGSDLVRPDDEEEEPRGRRRSPALLIWIAVVAIIGLIFVLPAVDREMMRSPMVNMMTAVNARDIPKLRASFTPAAEIGVHDLSFTASEAINAAEPYLREYGGTGNLRFDGFKDIKRIGKGRYEADFTVKIDVKVEDEVLPYKNMAVTRTGHVRLQRMGWFRWKIAYLTSNELEFEEALSGLLLRKMLPW